MSLSGSGRKPAVVVFGEDAEMRDLLIRLVDGEGYDVKGCGSLRDLAETVRARVFDLLVVDSPLTEGGLDGLWNLAMGATGPAKSKKEASPALLIISDRHREGPAGLEESRIARLLRPFDRAGFLGALRAVSRFQPDAPGVFRLGPIRIDLRTEDVECAGSPVRLTASEYRLLIELMRSAGQVLSREHLIQRVQGEGVIVVDRAIDTHVVSLRKKLGAHGDRIETVRGAGYLMRRG